MIAIIAQTRHVQNISMWLFFCSNRSCIALGLLAHSHRGGVFCDSYNFEKSAAEMNPLKGESQRLLMGRLVNNPLRPRISKHTGRIGRLIGAIGRRRMNTVRRAAKQTVVFYGMAQTIVGLSSAHVIPDHKVFFVGRAAVESQASKLETAWLAAAVILDLGAVNQSVTNIRQRRRRRRSSLVALKRAVEVLVRAAETHQAVGGRPPVAGGRRAAVQSDRSVARMMCTGNQLMRREHGTTLAGE